IGTTKSIDSVNMCAMLQLHCLLHLQQSLHLQHPATYNDRRVQRTSQYGRPCGSDRHNTISCGASPLHIVAIYWTRLERIREDVPVLQPVHSTSSPQARESAPNPEAKLQVFTSLMAEDGGIKTPPLVTHG